VLVGVISFRSNLCYTGPLFVVTSSGLCLFGWFRCFRSLVGVYPIVSSLFLWICFVVYSSHARLSSYILFAGFRWAGSFGFEIGSRVPAAISVLTCFGFSLA
jgi:hypothetical protein